MSTEVIPHGREKTRILLAMEHALLRQGVARILSDEPSFEVVGQAVDDEDTLHQLARLRPQVLLLDAALPRQGGVPLAEEVRRRHPDTRVVVLTLSEDDELLFAALRAGVMGLLDKTADARHLTRCVRDVVAGEMSVSKRLASRLLQKYAWLAGESAARAKSSHAGLTARELETLELLAAGCTNRQIAQRLIISENTVRTHLRSIMQKLNVQNRVQVAAYALAHGLARSPYAENGQRERTSPRPGLT